MDHEVFVPVLPDAVRQTLADPARVARCLPGFQQDADKSSTPLTGRLKVRLGGHTITYRGALTVTPAAKGTFTVEGEGSEARGNGSVKLSLTVRTAPADGGTKLSFTGTAGGDGRIAELDVPTVESAVHRLLDRFGTSLATEAEAPKPKPKPKVSPKPDPQLNPDPKPKKPTSQPFEGLGFEAEEPTLDDSLPEDEEAALRAALEGLPEGIPEAFRDDEPPAEAAHARRTMIGRSAEEVDHAPPRGRYAPVMAPAPASGTFTLRRLAPAAALAVASAVVVGRVLRRRR